MTDNEKARLRANVATIHRNASTWVLGALGIFLGLWLELPAEERQKVTQALLDAFPWAEPWMGVVSAVAAVLVARVLPQRHSAPVEPPAQARMDDDDGS
jgi:nicotinamide riboside transporter PnuC